MGSYSPSQASFGTQHQAGGRAIRLWAVVPSPSSHKMCSPGYQPLLDVCEEGLPTCWMRAGEATSTAPQTAPCFAARSDKSSCTATQQPSLYYQLAGRRPPSRQFNESQPLTYFVCMIDFLSFKFLFFMLGLVFDFYAACIFLHD